MRAWPWRAIISSRIRRKSSRERPPIWLAWQSTASRRPSQCSDHVDREVGVLAAGEEHLVHLVRGEAVLLVARVVEPVAHKGVDGVGGEHADVAVVAMVEATAEGIPGHDRHRGGGCG